MFVPIEGWAYIGWDASRGAIWFGWIFMLFWIPHAFYPNKNQTSHRWDTQMWSRNWNGYSNPDGTWNHWSSQRSSTCIWLWIRRNSLKHIILDPDSGVTCHVTFSQLKVEQVWWRKCPELFWWQHEGKVMNAFRTNVVHLLFFLLGIWTKHG